MSSKRRSKAETRDAIMAAISFTKKMAEAKKLSFTLREVARQADVSHTLITLEHPEIGALIREIKDGLKNPGEVEAKVDASQKVSELACLRLELKNASETILRYARANHSLSQLNEEFRSENERLRGLIPNAKVVSIKDPSNSV